MGRKDSYSMSNLSSDQQPPSESSYIFDSESASEMARLTHQGQLLTKAMHGPLAGIDETDIAQWRQVLDIGCGPGDWVFDVAFDYPTIEVAGIDVSRLMVDYANARARSQHLGNASFEVMDIRSPLDFPDGAFDMVNARFLFGVLRRDEWVPFIRECMRILRPGGLLRLTEPIDICVTSSPAHGVLAGWFLQLLRQNGYGFSVDKVSVGLTYKLPRLLREVGCQGIEQIGHCLDFSGDTGNWTAMYRNFEISLGAALPLFAKVGIATQEEATEQYQRMLIELHADDFCGAWHFASFQARKP
jgi:SAM-dependent methyltransferase